MSITLGTMDVGVSFVGDSSALQSATAQAQGGLEKFGATSAKTMRQVADDTAQANAAMQRLATGLKGAVVGGSLAVGLVKLKNSITEMSAAIIDAQVQLDKWNNGFKFGAGSMAAGTREMAFVREEAQRLGLELSGSASQYMKLVAASRGTTMEGEKTRQVFTAIAEAATVMGMSSEQSERAFMAVTQMMSKGKVQAEELRGQLGEHLPGAFAIAARAMGVTEMELNKLMETGNVMSADFLPKFGAQLRKELAGSVEDATKSMQASLNRYETAWLTFKQNVAQSGVSDFIGGQINILSDALANISTRMEDARGAGGGFWAQTAAGAAGVAQFINPLNAFSYSAQSLDMRLKEAQTSLVTLQERAKTSPESPFFRVEIAQTQLLIQELQRAMQAKAMLDVAPGPSGSVASGDSALARANQADYEKRLAAYKGLMASMASPQEKFNTELAKQKALLGDLFTPDVEARLRAHYIKPVGQARDKTDEFAKALESLQEKATGLNTNYSETLATLYQGLNAGRFGQGEEGIANYRAAVESLIKLQPFFKDGLREEAEALKASQDAMAAKEKATAEYYDGLQKELGALSAKVEALQLEGQEIGLTDEALLALTLRRLDDAIATEQQALALASLHEASGEELAIMQRRIALLKEQRTLTATNGQRQIAAEAAKDAYNEWKKTSQQIEQSLTDALMRGFESGKGFAEVLRDTVANMFKTLVLRPVIQATVQGGLNAVGLGSLGGASGGGGLLGAASNAYGAYNAITGMGGLASSAGILSGAAYGTTALSSQSMMLAAQEAGFGAAGVGTAGNIGAVLSNPATIALGAVLALSALSKATKGETRYGGQYGYSFDGTLEDYRRGGDFAGATAGVNRITGAGEFAEAEVQAAIAGTVTSINALLKSAGSSAALVGFQAGLETSGKGRGGVFSGGTLSTGATFGESGIGGSPYDGNLFEKTSTQSPDAQTALANFALDLQQATIQALQAATGIPGALKKLLQGVDAEALTADAAAALLGTVQAQISAVGQLRDAFDGLGWGDIGQQGWANVEAAAYNAAVALAEASGGFDALAQNLAGYYANFYTEAEQQARATETLTTQLAGLGQALPTTREGFRGLVESAEAAGNTTLLAGLLSLQGEFAALVPATTVAAAAVETISDTLRNLQGDGKALERELLALQGGDLRAFDTDGYSAAELAAYDYNDALRDQITALNDATAAANEAAAAEAARIEAVAAERGGLERQLLGLQGDTAALRALELTALDETNRALQEQIWAYQDQAEAIASAAEAIRALASESKGLERQLLELQGGDIRAFDTEGMTEAQLAIYDYNQGLRDQIAALKDAKNAQDAAAQAAVDAAKASQAAAQAAAQAIEQAMKSATASVSGTRFGLDNQLLTALGFGGLAQKRTDAQDLAGLTEGLPAEMAAQIAKAFGDNVALRDTLAQMEAAQQAQVTTSQTALETARNTATAAESARDALRSLFDLLGDSIESLRGNVASTAALQAAEANAYISQASALIRSGAVPDQGKLQAAIRAATAGIDGRIYASSAEQEFDRLVLAGKLADLQDGAASQLTIAEQHLSMAQAAVSLAQQQLDALNSIASALGNTSTAPKEQWSTVAGQSVWASSGGAVGVKTGTGIDIYGIDGRRFTDTEAIDYVGVKLRADDPMSVYAAAIEKGISANSLDGLMGWAAGTSNEWAKNQGLPQFAVGTNYVPRDMVALVHEGEMIVPKAYNPAANPGMGGNTERLERLVEGLTAEVQRLQAIANDGTSQQRRMADTLDNVTEGGNQMRTTAA